MATPQTYENHARFVPIYHFVALPILVFNLLVSLWTLVKNPTGGTLWGLLVAFALLAAAFYARVMALSVQDRVIRLEQRLRMTTVLPPAQMAQFEKLSPRQLVALRFASDKELSGLVQRVLDGDLTEPLAIKKAITDWQPDTLRA